MQDENSIVIGSALPVAQPRRIRRNKTAAAHRKHLFAQEVAAILRAEEPPRVEQKTTPLVLAPAFDKQAYIAAQQEGVRIAYQQLFYLLAGQASISDVAQQVRANAAYGDYVLV